MFTTLFTTYILPYLMPILGGLITILSGTSWFYKNRYEKKTDEVEAVKQKDIADSAKAVVTEIQDGKVFMEELVQKQKEEAKQQQIELEEKGQVLPDEL